MTRGTLALLALGAAIVVIACRCGGDEAAREPTGGADGSPVAIDQALASRGATLYAAQCASCHGAAGEGQPEWRVRRADGTLPAPPHDSTGHTWHHADGLLFRIVRDGCDAYGGPATCRMPAFGATLDDDEIRAVIEHLRTLWSPADRAFQRSVSRADPFPSE